MVIVDLSGAVAARCGAARLLRRRLASCSSYRAYASTISPTSRWRTTSVRRQVGEVDVLDVGEDVAHDPQAATCVAGQVDLGDVAGDHDLRAEAEPGQEHLHLLGRGVLRLVQDDERVVEGATAHVGQRRDLDGPGLHQPRDRLRIEHVVQRVHSGRRYGSILSYSVPGRKPSRSPASTAGRVRMMRLTCLACSACTALATAR